MVTLRRPPQYTRPGPALEPYQVILRPIITEKSTHMAEPPDLTDEQREKRKSNREDWHPAYTFEVNPLATKTEIKHAVETLFDVKVVAVRTQNRRGKLRRYRMKSGHTRNWKKAIVALDPSDRIDFY